MKNKTVFAALVILLTGSTAVPAQQTDHSHASQHGGVVKAAGDFHIEAALKGDVLTVDLIILNEKTMPNKGVTGTSTVLYADGSVVNEAVTASGNDHFIIKFSKPDWKRASITFITVNKQTVSAAFFSVEFAAASETPAGYSCPMHPEVKSPKAGKCPKCGMALSEKKEKEKEKHNEGDGHKHPH